MRAFFRLMLAGFILLGAWAAPAGRARAANLDTIADIVLGQPDFSTGDLNHGGLNASALNSPKGTAVDSHSGRLYVADADNNRVLSWPDSQALANGQPADIVLGQPNFFTNTVNNGGPNAASLYNPAGVAVDSEGNLYVADNGNNRVLRYTAPFTTHASASAVWGQPDFLSIASNNGGVAVGLDGPHGLALDSQDTLYVADTYNNRVLIWAGPVQNGDAYSFYMGQPTNSSNADNAGGLSASSFSSPVSVAVDNRGKFFVADTGNNRVLIFDDVFHGFTASRVIGQPSLITNTANTSGLNASGLYGPIGVAADAGGNVYVSDSLNHRVLEYNVTTGPTLVANHVFGQPDFNTTGIGTSDHELNTPYGVAVDGRGNLFVADLGNNRELKFDAPIPLPEPQLSSLSPSLVAAGSPSFKLTANGTGFLATSVVRWNGSARPTTFISSNQLVASISAADVASGGPFAITVFTPAPAGGGASLLVNLPLYARASQDATADEVIGQPNFQDGTFENLLLPGLANQLAVPKGVAVDRNTGRLFVADATSGRVLSWPNAASLANAQAADLVIGRPNFSRFSIGTGPGTASRLNGPVAVAVDPHGNLYVSDTGNRVLEFTAPLSNGMAASLVFGQGGSFTGFDANNGGISENSLHDPEGLAVDGQGNLYVADNSNNRILEYNTPLTTDTTADHVFGQPSFITDTVSADSPTAASLSRPSAVAVDAQGNLYAADYYNNRVLKYNDPLTTDALADVVIGQDSFFTNTTNAGGVSATSLGRPSSLAVDGQGNLFVGDSKNYRVLEYDAPLASHAAAQRVFGQPDFFSFSFTPPSATSVTDPLGLALDGHGNLFVADSANGRVLIFDRPLPLLRVLLPLMRR